MDVSTKTNRIAIISFISGLIALSGIVLTFVLYNAVEISGSMIGITDGIIIPVRNLCAAVSLLTGILALKEIKNKGGTEKGKIISWIGIGIGAVWILIGLFIGMTFLLAEILH